MTFVSTPMTFPTPEFNGSKQPLKSNTKPGGSDPRLLFFRRYFIFKNNYQFWKITRYKKRWSAVHKWGPIFFTEARTLNKVINKIQIIEWKYEQKIIERIKQ